MRTTAQRAVRIQAGDAVLEGDLTHRGSPSGVVLFAHGSGSSRHSSRNRLVASRLNERGFATLLFDLLTSEEERVDSATGHLRFDIGLLADRLQFAMQWIRVESSTAALPLGLFGASTGAAAALIAAAKAPEEVRAVVSRGGRPDLAGDALSKVLAPTLLIVGSLDTQVITLNGDALALMPDAGHEMTLVKGASHLFEEPGKLEDVAALAGEWFQRHINPSNSAPTTA